ncbi:MAG: diaminopimelate decarboxylase [Angelakisella sp.]|nr:diaminopimelate decarboxylase [Angelakisella sp.]
MLIAKCLDTNALGHLTIGGRDTVELAQNYGTPLYVMDEGEIRRACRSYHRSIEKFYDGKGLAAFASKAFCCKALCRIVKEEQMGLDVVSGGELYTAMAVDFPPDKIIFHGNNKTMEELTMALEYGVGRIVVDNHTELVTLNQLARAMGKKVGIMLRIKPGIDAHTHDFVRTGQIDSKFGFALETGEAMEAVKAAVASKYLQLLGIHCHIGSQIFDIEPFEHAAEVMIAFLAQIRDETGVELPELNLGGGFGIKYIPENDPVEYDRYMEKVSATVKRVCAQKKLATPYILIEPGRSIVGSAGITLYRVGEVKEIPNIRTYVSVDGGMCDNPRYALYKSDYCFLVANKANQPKNQAVTVAGKCCETGDLLGEHVPLQQVNPGDVMAVLATGAYNYSMSSNYNRNPRPPVVMIGEDGSDRVIIRRETMEDIIRNDLD